MAITEQNLKGIHEVDAKQLVRLDIGCGPLERRCAREPEKGPWLGVDAIAFEGVDYVFDMAKPRYGFEEITVDGAAVKLPKVIGYEPWPIESSSVDEINAMHILEHFDGWQRVHIYNEIWRVLRHGGECQFQCPVWSSSRAYGDPQHVWPPVGPFHLFYIKEDWRQDQARHDDIEFNPLGYDCNFKWTWGCYGLNAKLQNRDQEYLYEMLEFGIETYQDIAWTVFKMARGERE